jgi:general secretion pathway protein I
MMQDRHSEAGFTLIETLVALAVLAISAVGLLAATQTHVSRIAGLEARAAAVWAAENYLAEVTLGLPPNQSPPAISGFLFRLDAVTEPTQDADVQKVTIVATDAGNGQQYARLTGFVLSETLAVRP